MVTVKVILGLFGMVFAAGTVVALVRWAIYRRLAEDWGDADALRLAMGRPPAGGGRGRRGRTGRA